MRICIISDLSLPTPHPAGHGLGLMNHQIAEGLRCNGHDTTLIAKTGSHFSGKLAMVEGNGYQDEARLAKAAYQLHGQQRFDCFLDGSHVHMLPALFPDLPVVSLFHDNYQQYQRCPVLLGEGQRAMLPAPFETARIIPNALDAQSIPYSLTPGNYAVFLGAISDLKQPLLAVEACAKFGIPLVLAGMQVNNFGLALTGMNNARYIGMVSGKTKFALLRGARLMLQLSGVESFGLTTLEAMLSGTPVVALPSGGSVDLIEYGKSGILVQPSGNMVNAVCDAMNAAYWLDREQVRKSGERFGKVECQISQYEVALADCMKGCWW